MDTDKALKSFFKGTVFVAAGSVFGMGFEFLTRLLLIRNSSPSDYGMFALGFTLFSVTALLATLGLQDGLPRQIAYFLGQKKKSQAVHAAKNSFSMVLIWSAFLSLAGYFASGTLANIFNNTSLISTFRIFFLAVPFYAAIIISTSAFRGIGNVQFKAFFQDFLLNISKLILVAVFIFAGVSFLGLIKIYAAVYAAIAAATVVFFIRKFQKGSGSSKKQLLLLSLPLLGTSFFYLGLLWADTLILGMFRSTAEVGLYNGVANISRLLRVVLTSSIFVYAPLAANLFGMGKLLDLKEVYSTVTKWLIMVSVPAAMLMMIFPRAILKVLYGTEYVAATATLTVITLGFLISVAAGPAGATLVALGKTKQAGYAYGAGFLANIILNFILIPQQGILGAAIASAISFAITTILLVSLLYKNLRLHIFKRTYIQITAIGSILALVIFIIIKKIFVIHSSIPAVIVISAIYSIVYLGLLIAARTFDERDLMLISAIERKTKLNLTIAKKLVKRLKY